MSATSSLISANASFTSPYSNLPADWLSHIFSHLPSQSLLVHARCVSSHWSRVSRTIESVNSCQLTRWRDVEELKVHESMRQSIGCIDLETMVFFPSCTMKSLDEINLMTNLSTLLLSSSSSSSASLLDLTKLKHLKKLRVHATSVPQKFFQAMKGNLPKLSELILAGRPTMTSSSSSSVERSNSLSNSLEWLLDFNTLTSLHFSSWTRDLPHQLIKLATLPRLSTLRLEIYHDETASQGSLVEIIDHITNLPHLTDLSLKTNDLVQVRLLGNQDQEGLMMRSMYLAKAMVMQQLRRAIQSNDALPSLQVEPYFLDPRPCCGFSHLHSLCLLSPQDLSQISSHEDLQEFAQLMKHPKKLELAIRGEEEHLMQQTVEREEQNSDLADPMIRFTLFISYLPFDSALRDLTLTLMLPMSLDMLCLAFELKSSPMPHLTSLSLTIPPPRTHFLSSYTFDDNGNYIGWDISLSTLLPKILLHLRSLEKLKLKGMIERMDWSKMLGQFVKGVRVMNGGEEENKKNADEADIIDGSESMEKLEEKSENNNLKQESESKQVSLASITAVATPAVSSSLPSATIVAAAKPVPKSLTKQQRKQMKKTGGIVAQPPAAEVAAVTSITATASASVAALSSSSTPAIISHSHPSQQPSIPLIPIPPHLSLRHITLDHSFIKTMYRRGGAYDSYPSNFEVRLKTFFRMLGTVMPNLEAMEWTLKIQSDFFDQPDDQEMKREVEQNELPASLIQQHPIPFSHLRHLRLHTCDYMTPVTTEELSPLLRPLQKLEILEIDAFSLQELVVLAEEEKVKNGALPSSFSSSSSSKLKSSKTASSTLPLPSLRHLVVRTPRSNTGKPKKERKVVRDGMYLEKFTKRGVVVEMACMEK